MLVLSRREGECIRVGDSVVITIVRVAGDKVRVGIEAPANVVVLRGELQPYEREENAAPLVIAPRNPPGESILRAAS
ncbi:MAG: carbon storage regulator [Planctomycetaceae bacterium]|nr:carbon storage regulator [Planctomycetaceae bacterium]